MKENETLKKALKKSIIEISNAIELSDGELLDQFIDLSNLENLKEIHIKLLELISENNSVDN